MLSKPKYGWSAITVGSWSDRCSYLDDVPTILLRSMINFFENKMFSPVAIKFDAEGYEYTLVFDLGVVHIITEQENGYALCSEELDCKQLGKELISDILQEIDGWTKWLSYAHYSDAELAEREEELRQLAETLNTLL